MVVFEYRPQKEYPNRTRITLAGGHIKYTGDLGTPIGSLDLVKMMINSVIYRRNACFLCFDAANFYLQTPMANPEYVRIKFSAITQEIIDEYDMTTYAHNGWIYYEDATTPGLWRHTWQPIQFVLIVDDFWIEYVGKQHAQNLQKVLEDHYTLTMDW